ncbi:MAG: sigma-54 dependent transcriptional regulator [Nitrospiraceae bacterium]|nr:sigma-54 dependent transcriptional regulator [Nitrospiraceae bacterium]
MTQPILIVDDKQDMLKLLERLLGKEMDLEVITTDNARRALEIVKAGGAGMVLADMRMPGMGGLELLSRIRQVRESAIVIMMTAFGTIDTAVEALKLGAYDFITKPFDDERLLLTIRRALEYSALLKKNLDLERWIKDRETLDKLIGDSAAMQKLIETIRMVAKTDVTVLITGETGTGKELAARTIHAISARAVKPFITVNCPAIPENILESELFGYRRGAFTGAAENKDGLFQSADGGTIVLDEIADISPVLQAKLLRVLQEKEVKPLGDNRTYKVDVRIIASTNQDLGNKIASGQFREDLFYRLNVVSIHTPSLREIPEDIPYIANHFLSRFCAEFGAPRKTFSEDAVRALVSRQWHGNVRQLQNEIKRAVIFSKGEVVETEDFNPEGAGLCPDEDASATSAMDYRDARRSVLEKFNRRYLTCLLKGVEGNVTLAAKKAGIERQSLQHLIRKCGVRPADFRKDANKK